MFFADEMIFFEFMQFYEFILQSIDPRAELVVQEAFLKVGGANVEDELKLEGKRLNTILHNYKEGYKKTFVTRKTKEKAAKQVIEEHHKEYPVLSTYGEKGN